MLFSIVTITKNNPNGLARTRASVEAQTFKDYEWIVVNGDAEPDDGIYDAMNKGIDRARGDYMIFMNAGDVFASSEVLARIAPHADFDFLYGDAMEDGHIKPARHDIAYGMPTHHQAMIYKRSRLRYDARYKIAADYKFTAMAMRGTIKHLPFPICVFETGGVSQIQTALGRREQAQIRRELGIHAPYAQMAQIAGLMIKKTAPKIYWMARTRLSTSRA
jgi:putative colanic acid biosynthesis glycosyltransferase